MPSNSNTASNTPQGPHFSRLFKKIGPEDPKSDPHSDAPSLRLAKQPDLKPVVEETIRRAPSIKNMTELEQLLAEMRNQEQIIIGREGSVVLEGASGLIGREQLTLCRLRDGRFKAFNGVPKSKHGTHVRNQLVEVKALARFGEEILLGAGRDGIVPQKNSGTTWRVPELELLMRHANVTNWRDLVGTRFSVGRSAANSFPVTDSVTISPRHCTIEVQDREKVLIIEGIKPANTTIAFNPNGERVNLDEGAVLEPGSKIVLPDGQSFVLPVAPEPDAFSIFRMSRDPSSEDLPDAKRPTATSLAGLLDISKRTADITRVVERRGMLHLYGADPWEADYIARAVAGLPDEQRQQVRGVHLVDSLGEKVSADGRRCNVRAVGPDPLGQILITRSAARHEQPTLKIFSRLPRRLAS